MRKQFKASIFLFLVFLIAFGIACYLYLDNVTSQIELKNGQIAQLEKIDKLNKKINADKDRIILLQEESIAAIQKRVDSLGKKRGNENIIGFNYGNKSISVEEFLTIFNSTYRENEENKATIAALRKNFGVSYNPAGNNKLVLAIDSNSIINEYAASIKAQNNSIISLNKRVDTLLEKEFILNFLQRRYHIPYTFDGKTITMPYNKLDTLLEVYPLIKDRIRRDDKKGTIWIKGLYRGL